MKAPADGSALTDKPGPDGGDALGPHVGPRPMADRVRDGFDQPQALEFAPTFLTLVLQTWQDAESARRRTAVLMATLIVAFQLMATSKVEAVSLGPFKLTDLTVARALLPALVAHLFYEWLALTAAAFRYRRAVDGVMRRMQPAVWRNDLHWLLVPSMLSLVGENDWEKLRAVPTTGVGPRLVLLVRSVANALIIGVFFLGLLVFMTYAYWRLFALSSGHGLSYISLAVTAIVVLRSMALGIDERTAGEVTTRPAGR